MMGEDYESRSNCVNGAKFEQETFDEGRLARGSRSMPPLTGSGQHSNSFACP